jgi:hypothetical protein
MNASRQTWLGILALSLVLAVLTSAIRAEDEKSGASVTGTWKIKISEAWGGRVIIRDRLRRPVISAGNKTGLASGFGTPLPSLQQLREAEHDNWTMHHEDHDRADV